MGSREGFNIPTLPVLHFSTENLKPGTTAWRKTCHAVRRAMEEYGSFMVDGYDDKISTAADVCGEALVALKELFDLPLETKMKNKYDNKPLNGYVGQIAKLPLHESMGIDDAFDPASVADFAGLMWPHHPNHGFSEKVHEYAKLTAELDKTVTRMLFESYGVEKYHDAYVDSTTYLLRLLKNRAPVGDEPNLGFVTHTDKSFTTILHQNQIDGLEIDTKDGGKINVHFTPTSFVVVAGDALMAWSNDRIISPTHRVIMNGKVDRYSMGLFGFSKGMIQVPEELVDDDHPLLYKPLDHIGLVYFFRTDEGYKSKCAVKAYCGI